MFNIKTETGKSAVLSDDGIYRYSLTREWDRKKDKVLWVMLNPSKADAEVDDPTIRRCVGFAKNWDYGGIVVVNLFALRATDPKELTKHPDPVGPENNRRIRWELSMPGLREMVVAGWGAHPFAADRARQVLWIVKKTGKKIRCLGCTAEGHPRHPLYVRGDVSPVPYKYMRIQ